MTVCCCFRPSDDNGNDHTNNTYEQPTTQRRPATGRSTPPATPSRAGAAAPSRNTMARGGEEDSHPYHRNHQYNNTEMKITRISTDDRRRNNKDDDNLDHLYHQDNNDGAGVISVTSESSDVRAVAWMREQKYHNTSISVTSTNNEFPEFSETWQSLSQQQPQLPATPTTTANSTPSNSPRSQLSVQSQSESPSSNNNNMPMTSSSDHHHHRNDSRNNRMMTLEDGDDDHDKTVFDAELERNRVYQSQRQHNLQHHELETIGSASTASVVAMVLPTTAEKGTDTASDIMNEVNNLQDDIIPVITNSTSVEIGVDEIELTTSQSLLLSPAPQSPPPVGVATETAAAEVDTTSEPDELDAIVMALQEREQNRHHSSSSGLATTPDRNGQQQPQPRSPPLLQPSIRDNKRQRQQEHSLYQNNNQHRRSASCNMQAATANYKHNPFIDTSFDPVRHQPNQQQQDAKSTATGVSESLSDFPSDIDSAVRDRYLTACRILKQTLIERETKLQPKEREFLHDLLSANRSVRSLSNNNNARQERGGGGDDHSVALSEAQISVIETASATLLSDPMFQVGSVHSSSFGDYDDDDDDVDDDIDLDHYRVPADRDACSPDMIRDDDFAKAALVMREEAIEMHDILQNDDLEREDKKEDDINHHQLATRVVTTSARSTTASMSSMSAMSVSSSPSSYSRRQKPYWNRSRQSSVQDYSVASSSRVSDDFTPRISNLRSSVPYDTRLLEEEPESEYDDEITTECTTEDEINLAADGITNTTATNAFSSAVARFDGKDFPFYILNVTPDFKVGVLTPALMESLRSFFPFAVAEENFWLKYSLHRDGSSLPSLLNKVKCSKHTVIGVETTDGYVFGAFCSSPWRVQPNWYGSGECFLWRLKRPRWNVDDKKNTDDDDEPQQRARDFSFDNEMEVYPYTGKDQLIQYCTKKTIAVGGGDWSDDDTHGGVGNPYPNEPTGIGFMVDGDLMGGETNACATFSNPRLGNRSNKSNEFLVRCLEVWTVTPCITIEEADKLEMHRLFVEEQMQKAK